MPSSAHRDAAIDGVIHQTRRWPRSTIYKVRTISSAPIEEMLKMPAQLARVIVRRSTHVVDLYLKYVHQLANSKQAASTVAFGST
jgi:hypothetical protein